MSDPRAKYPINDPRNPARSLAYDSMHNKPPGPATMLRLSNSEISDFQRCPRMHWLGNVNRLDSKKPPNPLKAAEIGTAFHSAMESYYGGAAQEEVLSGLESIRDAHADVTPGSDSAKAADLVLTMVEGYFDWLAETGHDSGVKIIAPERTYTRTHPGFPGVEFIGKLDLETDEGIDDFKTTARPMAQKIKELMRARQPVHYAWLMEPIRRVTRVKFRIARQSSRSERTSPPYYDVAEVPINAAMLRSHERHLRELVPKIQANYERTDIPAPAPGDDCSWRCPFAQVCPMFDDGSDAQYVLDNEFVEVDPLARYGKEIDE